jgi:CRISPR-associated protein Cas5t
MVNNQIMAMRLVIYQPHAHYRVPFTYQRRHTYPIPPYSTVKGLICNVLGIKGYTYGEDPEENSNFQKLKDLKISISGKFKAKTTEMNWLRNLSYTQHERYFGGIENRIHHNIAEHIGGQSPVTIDILDEVELVVYLYHDDPSFLKYLEKNLRNPSQRLYPLYLGSAEDWVVIRSIHNIELHLEKKDANFGFFFWIPQKLWLPQDISFDFSKIEGLFYRIPTFWSLQNGSRDFQYQLVKLNDGSIQNCPFWIDANYRIKGMPVFFCHLRGEEE